MQLTGSSQIRHVIWTQFGVTICIALGLSIIDLMHAWSGLLGGLISATVNSLVAYKVFVPYRAQNTAEVLGRMLGAEVQKLLLTGVLFALVFVAVHPLSVGTLFGAYLFVQVVVPIIVLMTEDRLKTRY
ncbi:MAG: ATP synthase subunit I [Gammaproteobacteria bacterium]|nr:ATP synthase subunit I [Gammaproteobacteria bacterium]